MHPKSESRAIVIGGSIAGLLTARVLSDHVDQVIVLEKDKLPDEPALRRGVPQSEQLHSIHHKGADIIQELFPDLAWDFETCGVVPCDLGSEMRWFFFGEWMKPKQSDVFVHWCERPRLEWQIRRRVEEIRNVRIMSGCKVTALVPDKSSTSITGVTMRTPAEPKVDQVLSADLVVDASGRGSRVDQWLEELGYSETAESEVKIDVGYASRYYQLPDGAEQDWKALLISAKPGLSHKLGLIYRMPNNQIKVSLLGWFGDHPTTNNDEFLEFARSLPVPDLYEQLLKAKPLTDIRLYKLPSNQWRHFEQIADWPDGLFVTGDAVCSFNPSFGQGMTVAALQAVALGEQLGKLQHRKENEHSRESQHSGHPFTQPGVARRFQKEAARIVNNPWMITTGEDLRFPQTQGPRPLSLSFMHRYLALVFDAAHHEPRVAKRFMEVMTFLEEPPALFRPDILLALARHTLRKIAPKFAIKPSQSRQPSTSVGVH